MEKCRNEGVARTNEQHSTTDFILQRAGLLGWRIYLFYMCSPHGRRPACTHVKTHSRADEETKGVDDST